VIASRSGATAVSFNLNLLRVYGIVGAMLQRVKQRRWLVLRLVLCSDWAMQNSLERFLLATRWTMLPLYLALFAVVVALYVMVGREIWHLFAVVLEAKDTEIVLLVLSILDLVLVANLLVMVALSSYETSISPLDHEGDKPDWLGRIDSSGIKVKIAISVVMISAIHLLRAFMTATPPAELLALALVEVVFVAVAMGLKYVAQH
jgi:uncharacterized protein (TIGR00645 family)